MQDIKSWPIRDPGDVLDYVVNWASWLDPGDIISSVTWTLPSGLNEVSSSISPDGKKTIVWISGGENVASQPEALVQVKVVTAGGRTIVKTIGLPIGPN